MDQSLEVRIRDLHELPMIPPVEGDHFVLPEPLVDEHRDIPEVAERRHRPEFSLGEPITEILF